MSDPLRRLPDLAAHLAAALAGPLPGARIHDRLSPRLLDGSLPAARRPRSPGGGADPAVPPRRGAARRAHRARRRSPPPRRSDLAARRTPGARRDRREDTALREAVEEIGVDVTGLAIAGRLTPVHIAVSGFTVQPIVALADAAPVFVPAPGEVAAVLEVPLALLADPATLRSGRRARGGIEIDAPYFAVGDHQVWGATAMLLGELLAVCGWEPA